MRAAVFGVKRTEAERRRGLLGRRAVAALVLLGTCFLATSGAILWELRRQTWNNAARAAENLVAALSQDIGRNIELYDLSLQAVVDGLQLSEINQVSPQTRQAILFDRAATAKYLGSTLVLDEHGDVVEDAGAVPPRRQNLSDRSYFTTQRDSPGRGLFISEPFRRRLTGANDWVVAFSRRISKPDGSFNGVVSSTLRLDYFNALFARLTLGPQSAVTLFRTDGTLLVRAPYDEGVLGRRFVGTEIMRQMQATHEGQIVARASLDGATRAITFAHIDDLPLVLFVAQSPDDILAGWNRWAVGIGAVLVAMGATIAVLARLTGRELRRRAKAEAEVRQREEQLRLLSDHATDVIVHLDASLVRRYVSSSSLRVFGYGPDELTGQDFRDTVHPDDREQATAVVEGARKSGGRASVTYRIRCKDGTLAWVESQFSFMSGDGGFTVLVRDVTQRKAVENDLAEAYEALRRLATTDALTGLANRRRFDEAMAVEWRRAAREERALTLLLLDVDRFKQFNDRYGHQEGDACLRRVAQAVTACVRRPADLVARYGGEEFAVLLPDMEQFRAAEMAERVRQSVVEQGVPHACNAEHGALVTVSIGYSTVIPDASSSAQDVSAAIARFIATSDRALYAAKAEGRNRVAVEPSLPILTTDVRAEV